jgi:hypothetical protein
METMGRGGQRLFAVKFFSARKIRAEGRGPENKMGGGLGPENKMEGGLGPENKMGGGLGPENKMEGDLARKL